MKDAVGKNDSSLLSSDSLRLLQTTLHNWGNTIRSLGSTDPADDSDNGDSSTTQGDGTAEDEQKKDELQVWREEAQCGHAACVLALRVQQ